MRSKTGARVRAAGTPSALAAIACVLLVPASAQAQRNVQRTPDGALRLVSKDVGDERWAITLDVETGIVTGNVYRADGGDPQYVWCWPQDAATDPMRLRCQGTRGCEEWVDLGEVELAASFFRPAACEASATTTDAALRGAARSSAADPPSSGLRLTPDTRHSLIAKDVGGLRWTISFDHLDRTITGNVFDPSGGQPQFVSCGYNEPLLTCVGASGCGCGACRPSDWTPLPEVMLPSSFLRARRCPATSEPRGLVATLRPSRPEDAVSRDGIGGFGYGFAVSGDVAVAGSPEKAVYVFENGPDGWHETARIEPFEPYPGRPGTGRFATQVDVSGTRAVVMDNGRVRVLERGDGSWTRVSTIVPPEPDARLGSVAIEGSTVALTVSSTVSFSDASQPDRVHVFEPTGGAWSRRATLPAPGRAPFERVGGMKLAGDRLVMFVVGGASPHYSSATRASLEVFERRSREWVPTSSVELPFSPLNFSYPVLAFAGDDLVVGDAPEWSLHRTRGAIRWLARGRDGFREAGRFSACSPDVGRFGRVLASSGDTLVVGAPDPRTGGAAGEVHLFSRSAGGFAARGRLRVGDEPPGSIALDGHTLLVGSTGSGSPDGGAIQVFDLDQVDLLPPVPCPEDPPDVWPGEEWSVEPATEHGMNPKALALAGEYALLPGSNTQGVVVARHGAIVAEWYEEGRDATSYGASWSVAKSIASALIGVAIERGDIPDESVSMAEFYPDWAGTDKAAITLRHVLQMTSGLRWSEIYATTQDPLSDIGRMASQERDQLSFAASKPAEVPPGTRWSYSSGDSMLFSGVIEAATGLSAGEYARRYLFGPLGMSRAQWWSDAVGHTLTYCCVDAPSREFARIGLLYARNGRWHGRQVLPERWVRDSAATVYDAQDGAIGYGYQWYPGDAGSDVSAGLLEAYGYDHQSIYVVPELDLVVVRNGHYDKHPGPPIADPNLFALYPAAGLVPGLGTKPPQVAWAAGRLLNRILESIVAR